MSSKAVRHAEIKVLKEAGKSFVQRTAKSPMGSLFYEGCGRLADYLGRVYGHARFARENSERDERLRLLTNELFPGLIIAAGPFEGMRYPAAHSRSSALLPKLLGSYESELHEELAGLLANPYDTIVDIGCAEGYYAVGMALRCPGATIYAFDTDVEARNQCAEMGRLNGIDGRIRVGGFCDERALRSIPLGERALIFSDCEGYEAVLFTRETAELLASHDIIIEVHDFIDIEISSGLRSAFDETHHIRSIKSVDDIQKALTYSMPQLERFDAKTRYLILSERRPAIMEWLVMTAK